MPDPSRPSRDTATLLADLVGFDTTSSKSNLALIDYVETYLTGLGVPSCRSSGPDGGKANLFATLGPNETGGVVLSGHTDVVPVEGQPWSSDPFIMEDRDDRFYGRGTCDMKGFIACALAAVPAFLARPLKVPIHLAFSFDEEIGCFGVHHIIAQIQEAVPRPAAVIIGEPTEMQVVTGEKGIQGFHTHVTGLETHSSNTHRGVSAIMAAVRLIDFLGQLAEEYRAKPANLPRQSEFDPPYTTISVGVIEGGTAMNIIPRRCSFHWECRPIPGDKASDILDRLEAFATAEVLPDMRARFPEAAIETTVAAAVPPLLPEKGSPAETLATYLTGANRTGVASFASEAGIFQQAGISAVLCGPGSIQQAHQPDEWIAQDQLAACGRFMARLADWAHDGPTWDDKNWDSKAWPNK